METFSARLAATGASRGLRAERKGDAGELFIYDVIGTDFWTGEGVKAADVAARLAEFKGVKTLNVYINSPGGDLYEGKAIYSLLSRFDAERVVYVDGIAASAASLIAMAGTRIITMTGATWMIHRVASGIGGGVFGFSEDLRAFAAEVNAHADTVDLETKSIRGIYEKRTGQSAADLDAWLLAQTYMDAETAKARGFTDEIADEDDEDTGGKKKAPHHAAAAPSSPVSLEARLALVCAKAQERNERFPRASPGAKPGEPGTKNIAATATAGRK